MACSLRRQLTDALLQSVNWPFLPWHCCHHHLVPWLYHLLPAGGSLLNFWLSFIPIIVITIASVRFADCLDINESTRLRSKDDARINLDGWAWEGGENHGLAMALPILLTNTADLLGLANSSAHNKPVSLCGQGGGGRLLGRQDTFKSRRI
jgi:hypothetical protein